MKRIGIVSSNKWINKIKEDLYLNRELLALGIESNIISWEDSEINYQEYDCLIIRSIWGYQHKLDLFYKWLQQIREQQITILNPIDIIESNIRKDIQFDILKKYGIPTIQTEFMYEKDILDSISNSVLLVLKTRFNNVGSVVIKPIISGSGNNTYLLNLNNATNRPGSIQIEELDDVFSEIVHQKNNGIMIQPFVEEIDNGEISCIFIDGENTHNVRRYPSIFHEKKDQELEISMNENTITLAKKVESILEYNNYLYMRVDIVEQNQKPIVMEVELTDPDLLTRNCPEMVKDRVIKTFSKSIVKR